MPFQKLTSGISLQNRLLFIIGVSVSFILAELAIGFTTHSVAVVADAFHYIGDVFSFVVALLANKTAGTLEQTNGLRKSLSSLEAQQTSLEQKGQRGSHILPNLAAFFNSVFLLALGLGIFLQAIERFVHLEPITNPQMVMVMGCVGVFLNAISALALGEHGHSHSHDNSGSLPEPSPPLSASPMDADTGHHRHQHLDHSLSIKAVLLHIAGDALNNLAVIISALVMWKAPPKSPPVREPHKPLAKYYADPACTMLIAILIMFGSAPLVIKSGRALMEQAEVSDEMRLLGSRGPSESTDLRETCASAGGQKVAEVMIDDAR
ncbi:uncharacterized protein PADG_06308 [Paracoccidioides brasiliensis Pb18]|uniref:Cation efflux protein transmembrane domain-containing protein n=1 Tax=Paracoccidioides brasiliensis (strain Pb18) TaxID=502780 RepID=C1GG71_PARBD|nr:uncharacterized protein PADG_06308 [Paracoccidioides brasiliensis Pb18]EEH50229.2 hypothetical protein PADG_06308 [Paracoccidioides brasiliensis Pb18]